MYLNNEIKKIKGLEYNERGFPILNENNIKLVDNYVKSKSSYAIHKSDNFVIKYFKEHKGDTSLSSVITKVILIDISDSTNLKLHLGKDYYILMAQRIIDSNIEEIIKKGLPIGKKFKQLASWPSKKNSKKKDLNLFIFVSKYITRVNQYCYNRNDYSILDKVVKDNLPLYNSPEKEIYIPDLEAIRINYEYDKYCQIISTILSKFPNITREMLDHFIWFTFKKEAIRDKDNL